MGKAPDPHAARASGVLRGGAIRSRVVRHALDLGDAAHARNPAALPAGRLRIGSGARGILQRALLDRPHVGHVGIEGTAVERAIRRYGRVRLRRKAFVARALPDAAIIAIDAGARGARGLGRAVRQLASDPIAGLRNGRSVWRRSCKTKAGRRSRARRRVGPCRASAPSGHADSRTARIRWIVFASTRRGIGRSGATPKTDAHLRG